MGRGPLHRQRRQGIERTAMLRRAAGPQGSDRRRHGQQRALGAIEYWSKADLNALNKMWQGRVERVAKLVETVPGVTTSIEIPVGSNSYPTLTVNWDEASFGMTVAQCAEELA